MEIVASSRIMLFEEFTNKWTRCNSSLNELRAGEMIPEKGLERSPEPQSQWDCKALLGTSEQIRGKAIPNRIHQNCFPLPVTHFQSGGNTSCQFGEFVVEHWGANFKRIRHGHTVNFYEHVTSELGGCLEIKSLGQKKL